MAGKLLIVIRFASQSRNLLAISCDLFYAWLVVTTRTTTTLDLALQPCKSHNLLLWIVNQVLHIRFFFFFFLLFKVYIDPKFFLFVYFVVVQLKHPSALDTFNQMMSIARGKKIVVCLDYDGTLSNIVDNPEQAVMTDKVNINSSRKHCTSSLGSFFSTRFVLRAQCIMQDHIFTNYSCPVKN